MLMRTMRSFAIVTGFLCVAFGQEMLNNEGVVKLVKSGMSEELIVNVIRQQAGSYSMSAEQLVALKEAGVSERLIQAMLEKGRPEAGSAKTAGQPGGLATIPGPGLFYKKDGEFFELLSEQVEWKTTGAIKNIASAGIVKKDLRGSVAGPSSRNFLRNPMEIVLAPPTGRTVNSYVLLPMRSKSGEREFNVGPVNKKSGVAKGAIPFGVEKVGENQFRIVLTTPLAPGEYGILGVIPDDPDGTSSKMYTFRILI
jgi:hypothetical protein